MTTNPDDHRVGREDGLFIGLTAFFCVVVILSNLITAKIFELTFFVSLALPAGLLTYPIAFFMSDLITELYGIQRAKFVVWIGFVMCFIAYSIVQIAIQLPPHELWIWKDNPWGYANVEHYQSAYESVFGTTGIALFASLLAYTIGQFLDIFLYAWIKGKTGDPHLWLRNLGSTLISQILDTIIVNVILLRIGLHMSWMDIFMVTSACYGFKAVFTVINVLPFYGSVYICRRFMAGKPLSAPRSLGDLT